MGYTIVIGQATRTIEQATSVGVLAAGNAPAGEPGRYAQDIVLPMQRAAAAPGDRRNVRYPSYTQWATFAEAVGLTPLFFDEDTGLMRRHPSCAQLTEQHAASIAQALVGWGERYPHGFPLDEQTTDQAHQLDQTEQAAAHLTRLIWLNDWVRWALANCAHPALYNT